MSCGDCINCEKVHEGTTNEFWCCEVYGFYYTGAPVNCTPPNDHPCKHYSETEKIDISKLASGLY